MNNRITGPEILDERINYMDTKSVWFFIDIINQCLLTESVKADGTIIVTVQYRIADHLIEQIQSMYLNAGWDSVDVVTTGTDSSLYGTTEFTFIPPEQLLDDVKIIIETKI
jgi:hypothetical protein